MAWLLPTLSAVALLACNDTKLDQDGDGISAAEGDCWDRREGPPGSSLSGADIFPGADEVPADGIDQDCAGDDDYDQDADGYQAVSQGGEDCDDTDPTVNPSAVEICDGIDNNCDGTVDEDTAADALTWYADTDGDLYGDAASTSLSCSQPSMSISRS